MFVQSMRLCRAEIFTRSNAYEYVTIITGNGCEQSSPDSSSASKVRSVDHILRANTKSNRKKISILKRNFTKASSESHLKLQTEPEK
jgi:hypothetical protein